MKKLTAAIIVVASMNYVHATEIGILYKNSTLTDVELGITAQGITTLRITGNIWEIFYFQYEIPQGSEQDSLETYINRPTEIEKYNEKIQAGIKPLTFLGNSSMDNLYAEYSKDAYMLQYDYATQFYNQEMLFIGQLHTDRHTGIKKSYGLFTRRNSIEILNHITQEYHMVNNDDAYGFLVIYDNIFMPYKNGKPIGLQKYGTGILISDLKIQYQTDANNYFFGVGLGLAHRTKTLQLYTKLVLETTLNTDTDTDESATRNDYTTNATKLSFGFNYTL